MHRGLSYKILQMLCVNKTFVYIMTGTELFFYMHHYNILLCRLNVLIIVLESKSEYKQIFLHV